MVQRIIIIHGRSTKPAKRKYADLLKMALLQGLKRVNPQKEELVREGIVSVDFVYYGDINNRILAEKSSTVRRKLTDFDPDLDNAPCLSDSGYANAIDAMRSFRNFDRREYNSVVRQNSDKRWRDDIARLTSTISAITTATLLNEKVIKFATADLGAYLMRRTIGSMIRERLHTPLKNALTGGDDVCLIAHSMGAIVSYDVLWKFSRMSEYKDVQEAANPVSLWLTLGSPLGEAGVRANLYDADERTHAHETDKHPKDIVRIWHNIAAHDDFISHDPTMKDDFRDMLRFKLLEDIKDHRVYNCWAFRGDANPHKFYGYLVNPKTSAMIADWIR